MSINLYQTTQRHKPEDSTDHYHHHDNLKLYTELKLYHVLYDGETLSEECRLSVSEESLENIWTKRETVKKVWKIM